MIESAEISFVKRPRVILRSGNTEKYIDALALAATTRARAEREIRHRDVTAYAKKMVEREVSAVPDTQPGMVARLRSKEHLNEKKSIARDVLVGRKSVELAQKLFENWLKRIAIMLEENR